MRSLLRRPCFSKSFPRLMALFILVNLVSGCAATLDVEEQLEELPLFRQIDARVGTYFTTQARTATNVEVLASIEIGEISVGRFEQAFTAMFTETEELPDWPPWRYEELRGLDGVIELETVRSSLRIGDDNPFDDIDNPDVVSVSYRVCLYESDGAEVQCWETFSSQSHQRVPFQCLAIAKCLTPQFEAGIRNAVGKFMVQAESDPTLAAWAERVSRERGQE